jgi:hypothetical protein
MSPKLLVAIVAFAVPVLVAMPHHAAAQPSYLGQNGPSVSPPSRARPRIEINPRPLLYRRCTDWYELQYRPCGTVLYPQMHCWWVRG